VTLIKAGWTTLARTLQRRRVAAPGRREREAHSMLWFVVAVLVALWLGGLFLDLVGGLIHVLLVLAVLVVLYKLFAGRFSGRSAA
jgi:hypothetical protein